MTGVRTRHGGTSGVWRVARVRVLLVDGIAEHAALVAAGLAEAGCDVVAVASDARDLTRRVRDSRAEVIVRDLDGPGRDALVRSARPAGADPGRLHGRLHARRAARRAGRRRAARRDARRDARRVLRGTLNGVVAQAPAWHAGGPALILVGEVAAEAEEARLAA
jgi:hypothetical protein